MNKLVYIIILNWNGFKDTIECVKSCSKLTYSHFRILVVENGSTDNSETVLREHFPNIEIIQTGSNLGFAGGNNVGIRHALTQGAEYVWLLNNDTTVDEDALPALVGTAESDLSIGMVGSKILLYDKQETIWFAGALHTPDRPYRPLHRGFLEKDRGQYDETVETCFITGCSLLVKRKLIEDIGVLAEELFLYFEDTDWCTRAKAGNWRLMYSPPSRVFHKVSISVGGAESPLMFYYSARNLLYFVKRHFPDMFYRALAHDVFEFVLVNIKKGRMTAAMAALKGIVDFFMARTGENI